MWIASYIPDIVHPDMLAHEYPVHGQFRADLVVGDTDRQHYLLVEFENGAADGFFTQRKGKSTLEWSPRFEHAFSQVVDWFWALEDMRHTGGFSDTYGSSLARFHGLVVIGQGATLGPTEKRRLAWREDRVVVDSHKISCRSFDDLFTDRDYRLRTYLGK